MIKNYVRKQSKCPAIQLTPDNLRTVAIFVRGQVKGLSLPREQRVVDFWNSYSDSEVRITMTDWAILEGGGRITVLSNDAFTTLFDEVGQ